MSTEYKKMAIEFVSAQSLVNDTERARRQAETDAERARSRRKDIADRLMKSVGDNVLEQFFRVDGDGLLVRVRLKEGVDVVRAE